MSAYRLLIYFIFINDLLNLIVWVCVYVCACVRSHTYTRMHAYIEQKQMPYLLGAGVVASLRWVLGIKLSTVEEKQMLLAKKIPAAPCPDES